MRPVGPREFFFTAWEAKLTSTVIDMETFVPYMVSLEICPRRQALKRKENSGIGTRYEIFITFTLHFYCL